MVAKADPDFFHYLTLTERWPGPLSVLRHASLAQAVLCNELTAHKASSYKTISPRIDCETPSEVAICLREAGHSTAALMVGLAQELMERPLVARSGHCRI